jgi:alpha-ketoglutaric semialdehyde dehydrogenase
LPFARLAAEAGVPTGVLNVVQGYSEDAGQPLVEDRRVAVVSFTGSTAVGRVIARVASERLAKICLELGGKNPLVVCDDANLDKAVDAAALSAFSNAGQRAARRRDHASSCSTRSTTASGSFSWSGRRRRRSGRPTTTSGP